MKRIFSVHVAFIFLLSMFFAPANAENSTSVRILCTNYYYGALQSYVADGHDIAFQNASFNDIVTAIATKNPDVDVFIFQTRSGLDQIKKQKYYYPLNNDSLLMGKVSDLYPAFQNGLMDDGNLIGWYIDAQPWGWSVLLPELLEEAGLETPRTFDAFLDVSSYLLSNGYLGNNTLLMLEYPFTQAGMMTFFMNQYLIASERVDQQIDFLRPEFSRTVAKIKDIVPETIKENLFAEETVFCASEAVTSPNTHIELIPSVLDDAPSSLYYLTVVAIINPYSNNIDGAMDLMRYLSTYESSSAYLWDSSLNKPHIRDDYDQLLASYEAEIMRLEADSTLSASEELDLESVKHSLQSLREHPYDIIEEDVAYYQNIVQYAYISGDSPITFDEALQTLLQRYLSGAFDAEGFARACQEHVNTVYLEMGLTPMYVPN